MPLTITQLFNPTPSGVSPGVTPLTVPANTWLNTIVQNENNLNLPTTAWQSGGVTWTLDMIMASLFAAGDASASLIAQGGFLDFAATGTVTYVNAQGLTVTVPVTPDPSIPAQNPTGVLGWLDVLADSTYSTQRQVATYAQNSLYLANTTVAAAGSYVPGTFHANNASTFAGYSNVTSFTFASSAIAGISISGIVYASGLPPIILTSAPHGLVNGQRVFVSGVIATGGGWSSAWGTVSNVFGNTFFLVGPTTGGNYVSGGFVYIPTPIQFAADLIGPAGNAAPGQIVFAQTAPPGCFVYNFDNFAGSPWQSNVSLAAQCRSQLQAISPNGAKGAYTVYALKAQAILQAQSPPKSLTQAITRVTVSNNTGTGTSTVVAANASGAVPGVTNILVSGATNASPIVLTVPNTASLTTGMVALVQGVLGNVAANGYWPIIVVDGTHISLTGSSGSGAYTSGGVVEAGDVGLLDFVLQAYADPNAVTLLTLSAVAVTVTVSAVVYVPIAFLADYGTNPASNKGVAALSVLFPTIPIGGTVIPGAPSGVVDVSQVEDAIFNAGVPTGGGAGIPPYTVSVQAILLGNGSILTGNSLPLSTLSVAILGTCAISVVGV